MMCDREESSGGEHVTDRDAAAGRACSRLLARLPPPAAVVANCACQRCNNGPLSTKHSDGLKNNQASFRKRNTLPLLPRAIRTPSLT